jgi:hypothetical protein
MKRVLLICCLLTAFATAGYSQTSNPATADPAAKARLLQKDLKLTDYQTGYITAVYQESAEKFDKIKKEENGNTNKMIVAVRPLRTATIKKIESILTAAEVTQFDKLVQENKGGTGNGWSDGWSSTDQSK